MYLVYNIISYKKLKEIILRNYCKHYVKNWGHAPYSMERMIPVPIPALPLGGLSTLSLSP
jgi:hypothetical protein